MPFTSVTGVGDFIAFDLADQFAPLLTASDTFDLGAYFANWEKALAPSLNEAELATITAINTELMNAVTGSYLTVDLIEPFWRWMYATQGVSTVSADMVSSGALAAQIFAFGAEHGLVNPLFTKPPAGPVPTEPYLAPAPPAANGPWHEWSIPDFPAIFPPAPAEVTFPKAPPAAVPTTPGGHIVKTALAGTTPSTVTMAGVDAEVAKAVSAAMQAETAALTKLVAQSVDQALGGLQPGQAKSLMQGTANAVAALRKAVAALQAAVKAGDLPGVQSDLAKVNAEVAKLISQLDLTEPSALDTKVNTQGDLLGKVGANLSQTELVVIGLETTLGLMPTPTELVSTGHAVTKLVSQMDLSEPSALDSHLNAVSNVANDALRVADDAEACCVTQTGNLSNLNKSLGGTSGLANLAKLAGLAFGLSFLAGIVDAVVAVFDLPAVFAATVDDVETLSGWADACATQAISDTSWSKMVAA
jgi:hypothetical protein